MPLYDLLGFILAGSEVKDHPSIPGPEGDNRGKEVDIKQLTSSEQDLPTHIFPDFMYSLAYVLYAHVIMKFIQCTEKERRDIARSDMEFHELIKGGITKRCGFKTIDECFGSEKLKDRQVHTFQIPKIPRGNEAIWSPAGEPDPIYSNEQKILHKKIKILRQVIMTAFKNLYPSIYDFEFDHDQQLTLVFNLSHKKTEAVVEASNNSDFVTFSKLAVPPLVDGLVIRPLVRKGKYINVHKRKKIYNDLVTAVMFLVEKVQKEHPEMCNITIEDCAEDE